MQGQLASRKRRAPGASPMVQQQPQQMQGGLNFPQPPNSSALPDDQYLDWGNSTAMNSVGAAYPDPSGFDASRFNMNGSLPQASPSAAGLQNSPSNQLVRRNGNNQLASRAQALSTTAWQDFGGGETGMQPQPVWDNSDDDEDLEQKALIAKKDAQAKRKQIPPFVQKLSSFLDESSNTELIRWSDDGNSFIVLDEDEFAKKLIPELFKHNNYASFVRQLNMYGFHKKVGLSDNSMKQSELKKKNPSEYYNKYFKRGRPELLWLIQKPKNPPSNQKRKREDDKGTGQGDSDEEVKKIGQGDTEGKASTGDGKQSQDLTTMPRSEVTTLRKELQSIQQHQKVINNILSQVRRQHEQLYQQAAAFQSLHDRHESSINAILTFLATFYNRSLDGRGNIADMFSISQNQNRGNVVDVGDFTETDLNQQPQQFPRMGKRPLALLPPPELTQKGASAPSASARSTAGPGFRPDGQRSSIPSQDLISNTWNKTSPEALGPMRRSQDTPQASSGLPTPEVKDEAETPNTLGGVSDSEDIMSMINTVNANNRNICTPTSDLDFSAALNHFENADGKSPLTTEQRNDMLSLIAADNASRGRSQPKTPGSSANPSSAYQNALTTPTPPSVPSLDDLSTARAQLEMVQRLQGQQESKMQDLADRLQPLSPNGSIPGLEPTNGTSDNEDQFENADSYFNTDVDFNSFVNNADDLLTGAENMPSGTAGGDVDFDDIDFAGYSGSNGISDAGANFGFDGPQEDHEQALGGGGIVESLSSEATSPANTVGDDAHEETMGSPSKRRRVG